MLTVMVLFCGVICIVPLFTWNHLVDPVLVLFAFFLDIYGTAMDGCSFIIPDT